MTQSKRALCVDKATDLGPQLVKNNDRMVGQDAPTSIPLANGSSLWYFGDTLIGERPHRSLYAIFREVVDGQVETGTGPFEQMITNTGLLLPPQTGANGLSDFSHIPDGDGRLKKLVPSLPGEDAELQRVWCMHGIELGERIYLGYMLVLMHQAIAGPDDMGFEVVGSGLAAGSANDWEFRRIGGGKHKPPYEDTIWWDVTAPQFGAAILHDKVTGYVYFYGSLQGGAKPVHEPISLGSNPTRSRCSPNSSTLTVASGPRTSAMRRHCFPNSPTRCPFPITHTWANTWQYTRGR